MKHTPLNGPDGKGSKGETAAEGAPDTGSGGIVSHLRGALTRLRGAVRRFVAPDEKLDTDRHTEYPTPDRPEKSGTVPLVDRERVSDKPVVVDSDDETPTGPVGGPHERPELLASWHDGQLTLSEPDETGAQMSSDVWSDVDP